MSERPLSPGARAEFLTELNNTATAPLSEEDFRVALRLAFASIDADAPHPDTLRAIARALVRYFSEGHV